MSAAGPTRRPPLPSVQLRLEPVLCETFLVGFREPAHADILRLVGDLLHTLAVETLYWVREECRGLAGMRSDVIAAAADLEHLEGFLQAIGGGICEVEELPGEAELRRGAEGWAERLGRIAGEMRAAVEAE